jgi:hypothetical protein
MNEAFLHYIWQFQYFDKLNLATSSGEVVSILQQGFRNTNAGPDFLNAKIKIGEVVWIGHVEIHIRSSEWIDHKHHLDHAYDNVVLHIVWNENQAILQKDGSGLPTIELKGRVSDDLLIRYKQLINQPAEIPCAQHLSAIDEFKKISMVERALIERLENKAFSIGARLEKNGNDWEQTAYQIICRNFGFKINSPAFERLSEILPYKVLQKHDQILQVEALLFGLAGFLDEAKHDEYFLLLKREFNILGKKYSLDDKRMSKSQWRFLRLRPANFPTIRLAQLAALLASRKNMFSKIVDAVSYQDLLEMFSVTQSHYWQNNYRFDYATDEKIPGIGNSSLFNLLINSALPLMVAYGKIKDDQRYIDRAISLMQQIPPEENAIIKRWKSHKMPCVSAADSQGLLELHNNYCIKRRCLDCNIGFSILSNKA